MVRRTDLIPVQFPGDWVGADDADGAGVALVEMAGPPAGHVHVIERIVVTTTSALASEARVYVAGSGDPISDNDLRDGSSTGNLDIDDLSRPIRIHHGKVLRVRWTGMTAGAIARATVQYFVGTFFTREAGQEAS